MAVTIATNREARKGNGPIHLAANWLIGAGEILCRTLSWVFGVLQSFHLAAGTQKQMHLVEALPLGNRRQLLLVICDNQRYLVGAGADSVGSILPIQPEAVWKDHSSQAEKARTRPGSRTSSGPRLVRLPAHQIDFEHRTRPGVWQ